MSFGQSKKIQNLDLLMKTSNEIGIFNGNIIVSQNGKIIYQNELGFTDYTKSKKLNRESTMPIGSITKEFNKIDERCSLAKMRWYSYNETTNYQENLK